VRALAHRTEAALRHPGAAQPAGASASKATLTIAITPALRRLAERGCKRD